MELQQKMLALNIDNMVNHFRHQHRSSELLAYPLGIVLNYKYCDKAALIRGQKQLWETPQVTSH